MAKKQKRSGSGRVKFIVILLFVILVAGSVCAWIYWDELKGVFSNSSGAVDEAPSTGEPSDDERPTPEQPGSGEELPTDKNVTQAGLLYAWVESEKNVSLVLEESPINGFVFPDGAKPESCIKITALLPTQEGVATLTCDTSWVNADAAWVKDSVADGKILQAFVRVEKGTNCFYVYCTERFNEAIRLDIYSMTDETISGVVMLEYDYFDIKPESIETNVDNIVF